MDSGVFMLNDDDDDDGGMQKSKELQFQKLFLFLFFLMKGMKWLCSHVAECL